jgi:hypothetical protein
MELLRLRVNDVDLEQEIVTIRGGKGDKDRLAPLARVVTEPLRAHMDCIRAPHDPDRAADAAGFGTHCLEAGYDPNGAGVDGASERGDDPDLHACVKATFGEMIPFLSVVRLEWRPGSVQTQGRTSRPAPSSPHHQNPGSTPFLATRLRASRPSLRTPGSYWRPFRADLTAIRIAPGEKKERKIRPKSAKLPFLPAPSYPATAHSFSTSSINGDYNSR